MNKKQKLIDGLLDRSKEDILRKLKQDFLEEDKEEPFSNRGYVEDTIKVFDMLIDGNEDEYIEIQGSALCDVVNDVFRHFQEER